MGCDSRLAAHKCAIARGCPLLHSATRRASSTLNGPLRVGKSTLARKYVDEHPGTLALDLDILAGLIGGWRDDFFTALGIVRPHGWAMATRHLRDGYDVVSRSSSRAMTGAHP